MQQSSATRLFTRVLGKFTESGQRCGTVDRPWGFLLGKQLDPQAPGGKERETKRPATAEELHGFMQAQEKIWEKRYRRLDGKMSMALSMLTELKKESKPVVNEESISVNRKFPLKTLDDVEELERELSEDVSLHNNLVTQLARICGYEEQPSVYKILYFVFTDEAAKHFCLTGKSGVEGMKKKKFMGTKICSVIMGECLRVLRLSLISTLMYT
ncbi:uncharacterized protein LOC124156879 isoform X2 [Ischnura elegans]|uniref:uncharacterized protein LOC124156879 isoform X2 n=1 Tax=Ischnura elegans TaxID=197161 RepID=UPI001ED87572|nr:uncharacterized protein LOC124156879 isoform X2 [Ischnura elegans]